MAVTKFGPMIKDEDGVHFAVYVNGYRYGNVHEWKGSKEWDVDSEIEEANNMLPFGQQADIYGHKKVKKIQQELEILFDELDSSTLKKLLKLHGSRR